MIELNESQQRALASRNEYPPVVVNPSTRERYLLVPEALFERVRGILEEEDEIAAIEEMYPLVNEVISEDDATGESRESA